MKMKDLDEQVSLEAEPDFGKFNQDDIMRSIAKKKDSADDDEAGMDDTATQNMATRLMRATDYPDGDTIKTDDGKSFKVGQGRASIIRGVLTNSNIKTNDRERLDKMLKKDGDIFQKVMEPKDPKVLQNLLMQMMGDIDTPDKSIY